VARFGVLAGGARAADFMASGVKIRCCRKSAKGVPLIFSTMRPTITKPVLLYE
jgi:hypothetical protein